MSAVFRRLSAKLSEMKTLSHLVIIFLTLTGTVAGENTAAYEPAQFFRAQILPILQTRCFECHSKEHEVEGELALDSKAAWVRGGESGPAITPGDLKKSLLIQAIRHLDDESAMPPKEKLPAIEIALLETWVLLGAPDPR
jgi:mono/diheme cytochrome c family protein